MSNDLSKKFFGDFYLVNMSFWWSR